MSGLGWPARHRLLFTHDDGAHREGYLDALFVKAPEQRLHEFVLEQKPLRGVLDAQDRYKVDIRVAEFLEAHYRFPLFIVALDAILYLVPDLLGDALDLFEVAVLTHSAPFLD